MSEITVDGLKARLLSGEPVTVLDIRERAEHEAWSIHGSVNLPVYDALRSRDDRPLRESARGLDPSGPVVVVCRAGIISRSAVGVLRSLGFDASSLVGGMRGWGGVWTEAEVPLDVAGASAIQVRRNGKGCLSYVVLSGGEAAVIDPSIDAETYLELARRAGARIAAVVETHVHADHLSRARRLAEAAGAPLHLPANERVAFEYRPVGDGDRIAVGTVDLEAIATPGHTGESTCYALGTNLFTGDTLFVGGIGRPDLERGDAGAGDAARRLQRSLKERLRVLPRATRVLPSHDSRPVPLDGRPIAASLGEAFDAVPWLDLDEEAFVRRVVEGLQPKPPNHRFVIAVNEGRAPLGDVDPLDLEAGPNRCAAS